MPGFNGFSQVNSKVLLELLYLSQVSELGRGSLQVSSSTSGLKAKIFPYVKSSSLGAKKKFPVPDSFSVGNM